MFLGRIIETKFLPSMLVHYEKHSDNESSDEKKTRTVRKSDYTPALALPKHMAGIFDKNAERKKNIGKNKKENDHFQSHVTTCRCEPIYQI